MKLINDAKSYMIRCRGGSPNGSGWVYSSGGHRPTFHINGGKVWTSLGKVKSHLAMFRTYQGVNQVPADWEIVEVRLVQFGEPVSARELVQPNADKQAKRQGEYKHRFEKEQADREMRELKRLTAKYQSATARGHE